MGSQRLSPHFWSSSSFCKEVAGEPCLDVLQRRWVCRNSRHQHIHFGRVLVEAFLKQKSLRCDRAEAAIGESCNVANRELAIGVEILGDLVDLLADSARTGPILSDRCRTKVH